LFPILGDLLDDYLLDDYLEDGCLGLLGHSCNHWSDDY
jgi:hypothetical protein